MRIVWMGALAAFSVTGCGEARQIPESFVVRDSAGIRLIEVSGPVPDSSVLELDPTWPATEISELGDLLDVAVRPDGTIVLLERFGAQVLVLDENGQELVRFGRPGDGPAEFNPQGLSVLVTTDSSILVPDLFQQRISKFSYAGELRGTSRFPGEGGYAINWRPHPNGGLVFQLLEGTGDRLILWQNEQLETLFVFPANTKDPNQLLAPVSLWDIRSDGLVLATSDNWSVRFKELDSAEPRWIARRPEGKTPISDADRGHLEDLLVSSAAQQARSTPATGDARRQLLAQVSFPTTRPALAGLHLGASGDVWVRDPSQVENMDQEALRVGSANGYGGPWWTVLTDQGVVRSRVRLPNGFTVTRIAEGWLYGIHADELGVERPGRIATPW
jgi:hypothetical protein